MARGRKRKEKWSWLVIRPPVSRAGSVLHPFSSVCTLTCFMKKLVVGYSIEHVVGYKLSSLDALRGAALLGNPHLDPVFAFCSWFVGWRPFFSATALCEGERIQLSLPVCRRLYWSASSNNNIRQQNDWILSSSIGKFARLLIIVFRENSEKQSESLKS